MSDSKFLSRRKLLRSAPLAMGAAAAVEYGCQSPKGRVHESVAVKTADRVHGVEATLGQMPTVLTSLNLPIAGGGWRIGPPPLACS